ncbi:MAG: transcriptional regulator, LuxR family [Herbinix sp.]|nr:transcriptional regulator, LuxR family [Herbinix sp.]
MPKDTQKIKVSNRNTSVIIFALLLSWVLAFPFEGQILYAVSWHYGYDIRWLIYAGILAYSTGTIASDFFVKDGRMVKKLFTITLYLCVLASGIFFLQPSFLWYLSLIVALFFAGCSFAGWGLYYISFTPTNERMQTAADVLIYNNLILVVLGLVVVYGTYKAGLLFIILSLLVCLYFVRQLPLELELPSFIIVNKSRNHIFIKAVLLLFLFIFIVSINIGMVYQVILPSFIHIGIFVNFYWSAPYILTLIAIRNLPRNMNRNYLLYIAIAMTGLAFVGYMSLDRSLTSYVLICSTMFMARAVFDLFWWSIIGGMLQLSNHPIAILGGGITCNVLGLLVGGIIGNYVFIMQYGSNYSATIALAVVFIMMILMPPLHHDLSGVLKNHIYLNLFSELPPTEQSKIIRTVKLIEHLTERESEIATLLMQGRTYKMIAAKLYLSENTIKTHIKNIYSKLQVRNKTELINKLIENHSELGE